MLIQTQRRGFCLINPKDLMCFKERDVLRLSLMNPIVNTEIFEAAAKEWISMVGELLDRGMHAGSLYGTGATIVMRS